MKYLLTIIFCIVCTFIVIAIIFFSSNNFVIGEQIRFGTIDSDFEYTCIPSKGNSYDSMMKQFKKYQAESDSNSSKELFRLTPKNYLSISSWSRYKYQEEWTHKLIPWSKRWFS